MKEKSAVEQIIAEIDNELLILENLYGSEIMGRKIGLAFAKRVASRVLEIEDLQATNYAKWSMEINELTGHFFTFSEWLKDDPKDH